MLLCPFFVTEIPQQNTQPSSDAANVDAAWNKMKSHVLGGDQTGTAGTHLTKAWIAKHPKTKFQSNPETGLSVADKVCAFSLGLCIQFS